MKKLYFIFFLLVGCYGYSQEDAWVYFRDKPNSQFYFDNPLEMLSQRSLDRRARQNIAIDIQDVPINQPYIDQIAASPGIEVKAKSKWMNALHIRGEVTDIQNLSALVFVDHIQFADASLNASGKARKTSKAASAHKVNKVLDTNVIFPYGNSANQINMLHAQILHQQNYTGAGEIIAVLDAGFPNVDAISPFQRLRDNGHILGGYNFVDRDENFYTGNSHGTMVLSTMGGYVENELVGTAPDADYYLFITEDVASENPVEESNWVEAAEMADSLGADVITSSLGYFEFDNPNYGHDYSDFTGDTAFASRGANIAFSKGIVVVASAGNSGGDAEPLNHVGVPAEATNVLAIGAVQPNEVYASFSSIGPSFDGRVKPDVMAQGQNSVLSNTLGNVVTASGTSFSGPIMAGAITSFWQAYPNLTNQQVIAIVKQSSDRFANPTDQYGYGIPDFQQALNLAQLSVSDTSKGMFLIYPNPAHDNLSVSFPNGFEEAKITFYNTMGQDVLEKSIETSETISLGNLNPGIYVYKIQSNSFIQSGKIIKN